MKIIELKTMRQTVISRRCVVALGMFDGVHIGHAALLSCAREYARRFCVPLAVMTFSSSVRGALSVTDEKQKAELFREQGADYEVIFDFPEIKDMTPNEFVRNVLVGELCAVCAVCGFNFKFGAGASGDSGELIKIMKECGGGGVALPPVLDKCGEVVSSSRIRQAVSQGKIELANSLLGREFSIRGEVVRGKQLGRTLEFPTANIGLPENCVCPKYGIYFTKTIVSGAEYPSVSNVGVRPSVGDSGGENIETFILGNFCEDIYGREIEVKFFSRRRDEQKFDDLEKLKAAVLADAQAAKKYFYI